MTPQDPDLYTHYGLPLTAHVYEPTRSAIAAYIAHRDDPIFVREPDAAQVRLVAEYCQHYINAREPFGHFTYPADELADLRIRVTRIRTVGELAGWLWDCRRIGIEPL